MDQATLKRQEDLGGNELAARLAAITAEALGEPVAAVLNLAHLSQGRRAIRGPSTSSCLTTAAPR